MQDQIMGMPKSIFLGIVGVGVLGLMGLAFGLLGFSRGGAALGIARSNSSKFPGRIKSASNAASVALKEAVGPLQKTVATLEAANSELTRDLASAQAEISRLEKSLAEKISREVQIQVIEPIGRQKRTHEADVRTLRREIEEGDQKIIRAQENATKGIKRRLGVLERQ